MHQIYPNTIDGRNLTNHEVGNVSHYLQGFIHPRWWSPDFWTVNSITLSDPFTTWKISINSKDSSRFRCAPLDGLEHVEESLHFNDRSTKDIPLFDQFTSTNDFKKIAEKPSEWVMGLFLVQLKKKHYSVSISILYIFYTPYLWIFKVEVRVGGACKCTTFASATSATARTKSCRKKNGPCLQLLKKKGSQIIRIRFNQSLVGGFNSFEKYARQIGSFPQAGVKIVESTNQIISVNQLTIPKCRL